MKTQMATCPTCGELCKVQPTEGALDIGLISCSWCDNFTTVELTPIEEDSRFLEDLEPKESGGA